MRYAVPRTMRRFFLVHGMKRSGNHAVVEWMLAQGRFVFCNNLVPVASILRGEKMLPAPRDFPAWQREKAGASGAGPDLCASLEDLPLDFRPFRALPAGCRQVLVVRDPENFFASRIRKGRLLDHPAYPRAPGPLLTRVVEGWKTHAREFLGLTSTLENRVGVFFNAWFADPAYRRQLSARLGLEFSDAGFTRVAAAGGGSSFDRTDFDGDNTRMQVLARAAQLDAAETRLLAEILADAELRDLGRRLALAPQSVS